MATHNPAGGIVLSRLSKSYGTVRAVQGVDLAIGPGETVALLGPNGAGKSTTIDMILGLARPDTGTVSVFGQSPEAATAAGRVGGMLQTGALVQLLSVRELVTMVASLYPRPLPGEEVLRITGTTDIAARRTSKLSGGQTQRVRFALAMAGDPDLLVLDEPTAALDAESRQGFWTAIRDLAETGKTVIFATHYLAEADAYADRIIVMAQGRVVADGPSTEIKARAGEQTILATLAGVELRALAAIPGVTSAQRRGDGVVLTCTDSDTALTGLLARYPAARNIEVHSAGLEEAFLELTAATSEGGPRR